MALRRWSDAVRFGAPGVILGLALACVIGGQRGLQAQGPSKAPIGTRPGAGMSAGESNGTMALVAPLHLDGAGPAAQVLYLIDTKTQAFAIYRVDPTNSKGAVKLEGARQYHWDLRLQEFNNQEPEVRVVKSNVEGTGSNTR